MARTTIPERTEWTVADLERRFGPIPFRRIRSEPAPGTATEEDVVAIRDREKRPYELVDGVLVEKVTSVHASFLATVIATFLNNHVLPRKLGLVLGADGMYRLSPGLIRIPDVSFASVDRLPGRTFPHVAVCNFVPDLAVEVLSPGNTKKEMDRKLEEYGNAGVRLVWYVDPKKRTVRVYTGVEQSHLLRENQTLDGGAVLPGFTLPLRELFADPLEGAPTA